MLVRGISLPATQLFVIAIENIPRGVCGQSNEYPLAWVFSICLHVPYVDFMDPAAPDMRLSPFENTFCLHS